MATLPITCGHCGRAVAAEIVADATGANVTTRDYFARPGVVVWLRCPSCNEGSVRGSNSEMIYPGQRPGRTLGSLPPEVEYAWSEARSAHSVAAYTAAEMMCRKILMHVAVDRAGASPGATFTQYVGELEKAGFITTGLKTVVDQVRKRGNVANHDLPSSSEQDSLTTLKITEHLLEAMYELPGMAAPAPQQPSAAATSATSQATVT